MSSTKNGDAIAELAALREKLVEHVSRAIQWPEPQLVLNLASRRGSEVRTFKHLQQVTMFHRENYASSNQVKHLYLIDGFLAMATAQNPVALYGLARSMFELSAFLHEVQRRLRDVTPRVDEKNWQSAGEQFFGLIVRARVATTHPKFLEMLRANGVAKEHLKPFNVKHCIQELSKESEHKDAVERYALLCDFVHHNLGSLTIANSGSAESEWARAPGGGGTMASPDGAMTITQYEYPVQGKGHSAVDELAPGFLRDTRACIDWINSTPEGPFPPAMIVEKTGTRFGAPLIRPPST
jgi:hypothetical protein